MTDQEIIELRNLNAERFKRENENLWQEYLKMDCYFQDLHKKN